VSAPTLPVPRLHATGEGPPVLLLHPLGVDRSFWDGVVADGALAGRQVLTYDFPGHGETPVPEHPYTVEDLAHQARTLLEEAGHARVDVVGVSLGGLVAQRLAADAPDLVRRLVVVDAVAVYPEPMREMWRDRAVRAPVEGVEPFLDPTLGLWFTHDRLAEGGPVVDSARRSFLAGDGNGYGLACRALAEADVTGVLGRITAPTLVVCGEDDAPPFTAAARALGERLPDARVVWLSPARHAGVLEQPGQFRDALVDFLGTDGPGASR
jgi:3-oxoadipate enol-lactonase